jgi:hypothetical protein
MIGSSQSVPGCDESRVPRRDGRQVAQVWCWTAAFALAKSIFSQCPLFVSICFSISRQTCSAHVLRVMSPSRPNSPEVTRQLTVFGRTRSFKNTLPYPNLEHVIMSGSKAKKHRCVTGPKGCLPQRKWRRLCSWDGTRPSVGTVGRHLARANPGTSEPPTFALWQGPDPCWDHGVATIANHWCSCRATFDRYPILGSQHFVKVQSCCPLLVVGCDGPMAAKTDIHGNLQMRCKLERAGARPVRNGVYR